MRNKTQYIGILALILPVLLSTPIAAAQTSMASQIFAPLEYLNLAQTYDHYAAVIDLFLYALIFIGVAQAALGPRFTGHGGKAICAGIGLTLAIAMAIAEKQYRFSLKSFGPIASGIVILLFGIMIYRLLHHTGLTRTGALSISYAFMFLAVHGAAPGFVKWLQSQLPFMYLIALIGLLASFYFAFTSLRPELFRQHRFEDKLRQAHANEPEHKRQRETVGKETGFIKGWLKPKARNTYSESVQIENDLQSVADAIKKHGQDPESRALILQRMGEVAPKGQELLKTVRDLRDLTERLLRADVELFGEKNRQRLAAMMPQDKELWAKELHDEVDRIGFEKKTGQLEGAIESMVLRVGQCLKRAAELLREGRVGESWQKIQNALKVEKDASGIAQKLKKLEKLILSLAKRDYRIEKQLAAE